MLSEPKWPLTAIISAAERRFVPSELDNIPSHELIRFLQSLRYLFKLPREKRHRKGEVSCLLGTKQWTFRWPSSVSFCVARFVNAMVYYGVYLSTPIIGGSTHLNFFLTSVIELPAIPAGIWIYNKSVTNCIKSRDLPFTKHKQKKIRLVSINFPIDSIVLYLLFHLISHRAIELINLSPFTNPQYRQNLFRKSIVEFLVFKKRSLL